MQLLSLRASALVVGLGLATVCSAHDHYFAYTYDWFTPLQYERELEIQWTQFAGGDFRAQIEYEYGVTDRYVVSPYLLFEHGDGKTKFNGWKVEQRYRFGDRGFRKVLPAIYLEVEKENDEKDYELEGKLIGTYLPSRDWVISGNLIATRKLGSGEKTDVGYSLGAAKKIGFAEHVGFEAFGDWNTNQHYVGPSFGYGKPSSLKVVGTAGIPYAGGGPFQFRLSLEKEF